MSFRFSILPSSLAKKISAIPISVGTSAGRRDWVLIYIAIPMTIPAIPRKIDSFVILVFVAWVYKVF